MIQRRMLLAAATGLLTACCTPAWAAHPADEMWQRDLGTAWQTMKQTGRPMVLFITTDACYYCDKMLQETYANRAVADDLNAGFVTAVAHAGEHPQLIQRLRVQAFPTTVIVGADSKVIDVIPGYVDAAQLRPRLQAAAPSAAPVQQVSHR